MKLIIAGSRSFNNSDLMWEKLDYFLQNTPQEEIEIVSGCAEGADQMGERYSEIMGLSLKQFPAPWGDIEGKPAHEIGTRRDGTKYWKLAGHYRNGQMAEYATHCILFDKGTPGTANMKKQAEKHGLKIRVVKC